MTRYDSMECTYNTSKVRRSVLLVVVKKILGGGFNDFFVSSLLGEMIQFD